jgi:hypothetical protein
MFDVILQFLREQLSAIGYRPMSLAKENSRVFYRIAVSCFRQEALVGRKMFLFFRSRQGALVGGE